MNRHCEEQGNAAIHLLQRRKMDCFAIARNDERSGYDI